MSPFRRTQMVTKFRELCKFVERTLLEKFKKYPQVSGYIYNDTLYNRNNLLAKTWVYDIEKTIHIS